MALTINGRRTGRAGAEQRRDDAEALLPRYRLTDEEELRVVQELYAQQVKCAWGWRRSHPEWTKVHIQVAKKYRAQIEGRMPEPLDEAEAQAQEGMRIVEGFESDTLGSVGKGMAQEEAKAREYAAGTTLHWDEAMAVLHEEDASHDTLASSLRDAGYSAGPF